MAGVTRVTYAADKEILEMVADQPGERWIEISGGGLILVHLFEDQKEKSE